MKMIKALVLAMATFQALGLALGPIGMPAPAAAVSARTIGFVQGVVQFNDRVYFEGPLKVAGASYRVTVTSFDWKGGGGGGGM